MAYDFDTAAVVLREIEHFALSHPELGEFVSPCRELCRVAEELRDGATNRSYLEVDPPLIIPNRELAAELVRLMSKIPSVAPGEAAETQSLIGNFLANVGLCLATPLFRQYPELIPGRSRGP